MKLTLFALAGLVAGLLPHAAWASESWPQFRGPDGQGHSDSPDVPLRWGEQQHLRWKTPIHGRAWSSPVVLDGQVWLTTATEDGRDLFAVCADQTTGKLLHDLKLFEVEAPQFAHKFNTYGSPTPVLEPGRIYVTFGSPGTACLDTRTGKVVWERRDFLCNHFRGAGSSPILVGDWLVMHFDGSDFQYVVALDKKTGRTVWKTDRSIDFKDLTPEGKPEADGDLRKAFSTPLLAQIGGQPRLISVGSKATYAYDPETGRERWRLEHRISHSGTCRPVIDQGMIFIGTGFPRGQLWALRPDDQGQVTDQQVVWKVNRGVPCKPSIVVLDGLIYMVDDGGIASCLRAATGEELWRERIRGDYSASPVSAAGRLYFCSEEGKTTVLAAGPQFRVLAENQLDDGFMASPAIVGKSFYLRTRTHLYRIEE